jgi:hypothetical protein
MLAHHARGRQPLQQGRLVADVLYLSDEAIPNFVLLDYKPRGESGDLRGIETLPPLSMHAIIADHFIVLVGDRLWGANSPITA